MEINSNTIKIIGTAEIPEPLIRKHEYHLMLCADCDEVTCKDNYDGKENLIWKLKLKGSADIITDNGEKVIVAKAKGSKSSKLRWGISKIDDYDSVLDVLINHTEELCEWAKQIKQKYG